MDDKCENCPFKDTDCPGGLWCDWWAAHAWAHGLNYQKVISKEEFEIFFKKTT